MPRTKTREVADTTNAAQGNGATPTNKMDAMRLAMRALGGRKAKPMELQRWLMENYNINMPTSLISNYKSSILKERKGKVGRPRKVRVGEAGEPAAAAPRRVSVSLEDIRTLKALADRIGADKVVELVGMVGK
jgi:hypothetical protein